MTYLNPKKSYILEKNLKTVQKYRIFTDESRTLGGHKAFWAGPDRQTSFIFIVNKIEHKTNSNGQRVMAVWVCFPVQLVFRQLHVTICLGT